MSIAVESRTFACSVLTEDFAAVIKISDDGSEFILSWHDYVANAWSETYTLPGPAFARLALLCEAAHENLTFATADPEVFEEVWDEFVVRNLA